MRALVIEPDKAAAEALELMFQADGHVVDLTAEGEEGFDLGRIYDYDLIVTEMNMPDMSGYEMIGKMRRAKVMTPILVICGMDGVQDKVRALGVGADDYLVKPFHRDELMARARALLRRSKGKASNVLAFGGFRLNMDAKTLTFEGAPVHVTGAEYAMLEVLALRQGVCITKEMFLAQVYGGRDEPQIKIIDVFICKLRAKLKQASGDGMIETIWGRGYMLRDPAKRALAA
jgi:two-component system cell cycle response regulator CtrA